MSVAAYSRKFKYLQPWNCEMAVKMINFTIKSRKIHKILDTVTLGLQIFTYLPNIYGRKNETFYVLLSPKNARCTLLQI